MQRFIQETVKISSEMSIEVFIRLYDALDAEGKGKLLETLNDDDRKIATEAIEVHRRFDRIFQ